MVLHKYESNYAYSSVVKQKEERRSSKQRSKKLDEEVAEMAETMMSKEEQNPFHFNAISFLSDADFEYLAATKHAAEEAIGWKMLPENIVFRVDKLIPIQTKWGLRTIVQLRDVRGQEIKVWVPNNVARDLKTGFKLNGTDCHVYIKSLGEKVTDIIGEARKKYEDFETVYLGTDRGVLEKNTHFTRQCGQSITNEPDE